MLKKGILLMACFSAASFFTFDVETIEEGGEFLTCEEQTTTLPTEDQGELLACGDCKKILCCKCKGKQPPEMARCPYQGKPKADSDEEKLARCSCRDDMIACDCFDSDASEILC